MAVTKIDERNSDRGSDASHKRWWMVRAGRGEERIEQFLTGNQVFVGFTDKDLTHCLDKAAIRNLIDAEFPDRQKQKNEVTASQLQRFRNVFREGDMVVTFDAGERVYHVGVMGAYRYAADLPLRHIRPVKWMGQIPRDVLSVPTRNTLGAIATIFAIEGRVREELEAKLAKPSAGVPLPAEEVEQDVETYFQETERRARELIADGFAATAPDEMVELVAELLRATGYHVRPGGPGADRGVDLYASPDPWMVKAPRIKVQIKHRAAAMGGPEVRNFIATLQEGESGIFVTTGRFSKDAHYEAERSSRALSLVDGELLLALYLEHYERLDPEIQALVPVKRVYLPIKVGR